MSGKLSSRTAWLPLAVLIICLAVWAAPIVAQGPGLAIDQASLRLWPEYDDPGLLVIFSGAFTGTATFPQKVAFPVPAGARGIQATVIAANGDLLSQPWQIVDGKLTYTLPEPAFQIEFYLDRPASSNRRDIGFTFETAYPIKNLAVSLQQPARATGFSATPQPEQSLQGSDGFTYYAINRADVAAGARLPFNLRYTKNDQGLSVAQARLDTTAPAPAPGTASPGATSGGLPQWLPILLIGLGVAALAGAVGYWFLRVRPADSPAPAPARKRSGSQAKPGPPGKTIFCTQCGRQFAAGDRFCANCGAARRS
jgi:hypothetical protein